MSHGGIQPIEFKMELFITPGAIFRALTSQTELRKWWAQRVIMSRNIVAQEEGRDMEMRLSAQEENHMVRYTWRGHDWERSTPSTIITFEIQDLGVSRGKTRDGVNLLIVHDGWTDEEERKRQEEIWEKALSNLKSHLNGSKFVPWWETGDMKDGFRKSNLRGVEIFLERMEKEGRGKQDRMAAAAVLRMICKDLDGPGTWFIKENGAEVEYRLGEILLFGMLKNGNLTLAWRDLEKILGDQLQDFASRMSIEQDLDVHTGKSQDRFAAPEIHPELWIRWAKEIILAGKKKK